MDDAVRKSIMDFLDEAMTSFREIEQNLSDHVPPSAAEEACKAFRKMAIEKLSSEG